MLIERHCGGTPCDFDPRKLTTVTRAESQSERWQDELTALSRNRSTLSRCRKLKEYYYTITFGSRVRHAGAIKKNWWRRGESNFSPVLKTRNLLILRLRRLRVLHRLRGRWHDLARFSSRPPGEPQFVAPAVKWRMNAVSRLWQYTR